MSDINLNSLNETGANLSVLCTMLGLAFIMVGLGITYAYRRILPYGRNPDAQETKPPEMLVRIFMNFMRGSWACFAVGLILLAAAYILKPGEPAETFTGINIPVALYYAAALGLLLVLLTYNVLHHRVKAALAGTDAENAEADRIARVHANYTEYVPTGLALLILLEWTGAPGLMVHVGGAIFTGARYLHAWGYTMHPMASFGRIVGIQSTLLALSYMTVTALYYMIGA